MKCLLKYKWVKLPRACLPMGKGVMGSWSRLAASAAFRRGNAYYCGYTNHVSPGMWSGGVVGIKSILHMKNRNAAMKTLRELMELGYLQVEYDAQTKHLSYRIKDWIPECSGWESMDRTVYATEGYGFLCIPRTITERLISLNRIFGEADAWLDLWCHTTFEDFGNAFSFLAPAVQYGKYGAVLSLEFLGHRWGWEKTKVWRFFRKYRDVFALYRLPSSYGCLIFNRLYPNATEVTLPEEREIMRIINAIRIKRSQMHCTVRGNQDLNRLIAWYSRAVIADMAAEDTAKVSGNRVALLKSYIRAYFSHGRNCKNCRSCIYDCSSALMWQSGNFKGSNGIRGPCRFRITKLWKRSQIVMAVKNESLYDIQEDRISRQSEAIFDIMRAHGIIPDTSIQDERVRKARQNLAKNVYHNTKLLMENYRAFQWQILCYPGIIAEELGKPFLSVDRLLEDVDIAICMGDRNLESVLRSVDKSKALLDRVNEALTILKQKPENGEMLYKIMYDSYIDPTKRTAAEIIDKLGISDRTFYRLKKEALTILSIRLWCAPEKEVSQWLEVLNILQTEEKPDGRKKAD